MSPIIAFFDMDYTLLDTSSGLLYVKYLRQTGRIESRLLLRVAWWSLLYKLSLIDIAKAMPKMSVYARHTRASETLAQSRMWFKDMVASHLNPSAIEKIQWHQSQGHRVVVISASTQFAVQPVAEHLGVDFLCTWLAVDGDQLTGAIVEPACYGEGKVYWARQYATDHTAQLSDGYFYSDSLSDRPLLEIVGHPIAVNPDPRLKRLAHQRGWPIIKFY
jgi:HAD superfamily hydrolase (TIGR01490 family)